METNAQSPQRQIRAVQPEAEPEIRSALNDLAVTVDEVMRLASMLNKRLAVITAGAVTDPLDSPTPPHAGSCALSTELNCKVALLRQLVNATNEQIGALQL